MKQQKAFYVVSAPAPTPSPGIAIVPVSHLDLGLSSSACDGNYVVRSSRKEVVTTASTTPAAAT